MATKLSISMNEQLLERVDKFCEDNFQSRSGLISIALKQYLDGFQMVNSMGRMSDMLQELQKAALTQQQPPQD